MKIVVKCVRHEEKTASLIIDQEGGIFHCFGCGWGGKIADYQQEIDKALEQNSAK